MTKISYDDASKKYPRLAAIAARSPRPLVILHDMDAVHAEWEELFVEVFRELYPDLPCADAGTRTEFNLLTGDPAYDLAIKTVMNHPGFYLRLRPILGGREAIEALEALGFINKFCSAPTFTNTTCASDKVQWLINFYGIDLAARLILTADKTMVRGDVLVDDKDKITGLYLPEWIQVLFAQAYNAYRTDLNRITDWDNFEAPLADALEQVLARELALVTA